MRIGILHIGDELLTGEIDPYPKEIICMIRERHNVLSMLAVVEDTEKDILALFRSAAGMGIDLLVVTGGLGPTLDDLTREAVANYLGEELVLNEQAVSWMDEALTRMNGRRPPFRKERLKMAMVPKGARALRNVTGAACGIEATKDGMTIFCFPGFPNEMVPMFKEYILPKIRSWTIVSSKCRFGGGKRQWNHCSRRSLISSR